MAGELWISGFCPMGCGETLRLGYGTPGSRISPVECSSATCPRPTAAAEILALPAVHVVEIFEQDSANRGMVIEHPLRERLLGIMAGCDLHRWVFGGDERNVPSLLPGRYLAIETDDDDRPWYLTLIEETG